MNVSLLKFPNKSEWLVVPNGYNTSQLIEIYEKEGWTKFRKFMQPYLINDKDGKPNILQATTVVRRYSNVSEITFHMYDIE
jgi:hypothetical protein